MGSCASAASVSGMRSENQARTSVASPAIVQKISRQLPNSSTSSPNAGARIGTIMNTMKAIDMTCAMARP